MKILCIEKNYDLAKDHLLKALEINNGYSKAHYLIAYVYEESNEIEKAKSHYTLSLKFHQENALSHFRLGVILSNNKEFKKAEEHLKIKHKVSTDS